MHVCTERTEKGELASQGNEACESAVRSHWTVALKSSTTELSHGRSDIAHRPFFAFRLSWLPLPVEFQCFGLAPSG